MNLQGTNREKGRRLLYDRGSCTRSASVSPSRGTSRKLSSTDMKKKENLKKGACFTRARATLGISPRLPPFMRFMNILFTVLACVFALRAKRSASAQLSSPHVLVPTHSSTTTAPPATVPDITRRLRTRLSRYRRRLGIGCLRLFLPGQQNRGLHRGRR